MVQQWVLRNFKNLLGPKIKENDPVDYKGKERIMFFPSLHEIVISVEHTHISYRRAA
jgi:hypothetical protein